MNSKMPFMISVQVSGSTFSAAAVEPFTSQNNMVMTRRSPTIASCARAASNLVINSRGINLSSGLVFYLDIINFPICCMNNRCERVLRNSCKTSLRLDCSSGNLDISSDHNLKPKHKVTEISIKFVLFYRFMRHLVAYLILVNSYPWKTKSPCWVPNRAK